MHIYETISIFLFLDKDLDFLIPTHSRRLTISFFVKKEMLMDDLRILVSKKKKKSLWKKKKELTFLTHIYISHESNIKNFLD